MPTYLQRRAAYEGDPTTIAALTLLMLTAVRSGELRAAQWNEIDSDRALWRIPAARMKMKAEHAVPLSKQALAVLDTMQPTRTMRRCAAHCKCLDVASN